MIKFDDGQLILSFIDEEERCWYKYECDLVPSDNGIQVKLNTKSTGTLVEEPFEKWRRMNRGIWEINFTED